MDPIAQLRSDADALDRTAAAAEWIAGLGQDNDPDDEAEVMHEAQVMRNWADLCRQVADNSEAGGGTAGV
jgi:hypothetical protein